MTKHHRHRRHRRCYGFCHFSAYFGFKLEYFDTVGLCGRLIASHAHMHK